MQSLSSTLQILLARFDGQVLIPFIKASAAAGISGQTARNKLSVGTFPIKTVFNGSRRLVHIQDLADFIESLRPESESPKPKLGRPTKASKFQAEQGRA